MRSSERRRHLDAVPSSEDCGKGSAAGFETIMQGVSIRGTCGRALPSVESRRRGAPAARSRARRFGRRSCGRRRGSTRRHRDRGCAQCGRRVRWAPRVGAVAALSGAFTPLRETRCPTSVSPSHWVNRRICATPCSSFADAEIAPAPRAIDRDTCSAGPLEKTRRARPARHDRCRAVRRHGLGYLAHIVAMEEVSRASASVGFLRRPLEPVRQPDPSQRQRGAEAQVPAEARLRRARRRAGDERARTPAPTSSA
jgi:hypothetical protein